MTNLKKTIVAFAVCVLFACQCDTIYTTDVQLHPLFSQTFNQEAIALVDISDDGKHILAGSTVEKMRYWSTQKLNSPVEAGFESELISLRFVGKDNNIFFANRTGMTRLLAHNSGKILTEYRFPKASRYSSLSNDSDLITYGEFIFHRTQNKLLSSTVGHAAQSSLQVSEQKHVLTSGFHDERVVVRDADGNIMADWRLNDSVPAAAISEDGKIVIASTTKGDCYIWQMPNKEAIYRCDSSEPANAIHINTTNNLFVLVMANSISAYQFEPFKKIFNKAIDGNIESSILARNNWLAIGLDTGDVQLWNVLQGNLLSAIQPNKGRITSIDINPSAKLLLVGSYDGNVELYQIIEMQ